MANSSNAALFLESTSHGPFKEGCSFFLHHMLARYLWIGATATCFLALLSTLWTLFNAYQLWATIQDVENAIIDLIDEACQILLPIGVCKQICHPHHIGTVNANYGIKGQKQDVKPGTRDNRYPEDVTFPPSDIEKVYDVMGDEDARKSKTMTLVSLDEGSLEEKPPKNSESDKRKPVIPSAARTPTNNNPFQKQLSREILLTPKQSLKTANEGTRKTASVEQLVVAKKSREPVTPSSGGSSGGGRRSKKDWDQMGAFDEKKSRELPSREQISGGGGGGTADKRTPSRENNSKSKSKKTLPPKMGTAEPI
ncbi:hypothetical protein B9Z55_011909 [Caenorhabditis nigoni]|uniref:Uncharacterized protein n=1 Tax=Caenorhabditis nigoni TaxID=1611254 RepID=A0A2G5UM82_9PELO|nr:hypothetical protein B9Z55_011909 [Caenorhabditis nigoni]